MEATQKAKVCLSDAKKEKRNIMNQLYHSDSTLHVELESFLLSELKDLDTTITELKMHWNNYRGQRTIMQHPKNVIVHSVFHLKKRYIC